MHAVKGGWVGQTFALAKRNESEGRKSRIRRSKEERKAMVETFIKKYQESNKGSFPSLNLTHKEVGGSFYTVREIVRDIIQENRVLGPAKFTLEEHPSDQYLEPGPLGSIAIDSETHHELNNLQATSEKMLSGQYTEAEHQIFDNGNALNGSQIDLRNNEFIEAFGKGNLINGSQVDETNEESVEAFGNGNLVNDSLVDETNEESVEAFGNGNLVIDSQVDETNEESVETNNPDFQVSESLAPQKNDEQDLPKVSPLTPGVIVETFPLRPVTSTASRIESFGEFRELSNSQEKEMKILDFHLGKERSELNSVESVKNYNLVDESSVNDLGNIMVNQSSTSGNEEEKNVGHISVELKSTKQAALEKQCPQDFEVNTDPQVKVPHESTITSEVIEHSQIINGTKTVVKDGIHTKNLTNSTESKTMEEKLEKVNEHGVNGQLGGNSQKRNTATLDRINLESWDGTPKNSVKREVNPLLAIFKAFVDAFVKFWSE
ncbi:uncharacterized protein G2W53_018761 [Senna tora]|uniref:AT3G52170-like helix-turn-helix domain-containing protein n=1 Tax=Senna tora TaxID=362788 RepID=A0A834TSX8_9FABA|nr:uncharacterized protein G2W53_018761 [Senna tora]